MKKLCCLFLCLLTILASFCILPASAVSPPIFTQIDLDGDYSDYPEGTVAVGKTMATNAIHAYAVNGSQLNAIDETEIEDLQPSDSINSVFDVDDRVQVTNTSISPYSSIGVVVATFGETATRSTAFLISPNVALTAGHNLFDGDSYAWATSVTFYAGANGTLESAQATANAVEIIVSKPWKTQDSGKDNYDWGLIRLDSNIGNTCGYFDFQFVPHSMANMSVTLTGYPSMNNTSVFNMYQATGAITSCTEYRFECRIDASSGQSGSPVYYYDSSMQKYRAVGIYIGSYENSGSSTDYNVGVRFTSSLYSFVLAYKNVYA